MTKPDKLLPCPFACPKSRLTFIGRDDWDDDKNQVQCNTCGTKTSVAVWNTRTPDPVFAKLVKHCEKLYSFKFQLLSKGPLKGFVCENWGKELTEILHHLEPETKGELPRINRRERK